MNVTADRVAAALVFLAVLSGTVLIPVLRPHLVEVYGASDSTLHWFFALPLLGGAIGAPLLTLAIDKSGQTKNALPTLAFVDAACLVAAALGLPLAVLMPLRVVQGAANVTLVSLAMANGSGAPGKAAGQRAAALVAALVVGPPLGAFLLRGGAEVAFLVAATATAAAGLMSLLVEPTPRPRAATPLVALLRTPGLGLPLLAVSAERFAVGCFTMPFALFAHRQLGLNDRFVGVFFTAFLLPFAISSVAAGRRARRGHEEPFIALGAVAMAAGFLILGDLGPIGAAAALVIAGVGSGFITAPAMALVMRDAPPSARSSAFGFLNGSGTLAMFGGSLLAGTLALWGDDAAAWSFRAGGAAQLFVVLWVAVRAYDRRRLTSSIRKVSNRTVTVAS